MCHASARGGVIASVLPFCTSRGPSPGRTRRKWPRRVRPHRGCSHIMYVKVSLQATMCPEARGADGTWPVLPTDTGIIRSRATRAGHRGPQTEPPKLLGERSNRRPDMAAGALPTGISGNNSLRANLELWCVGHAEATRGRSAQSNGSGDAAAAESGQTGSSTASAIDGEQMLGMAIAQGTRSTGWNEGFGLFGGAP